MQPSTITLAVDELNNGTTVDTTLTRFEEHLNRSRYITSGHSLSLRDEVTLYRTFPKQNGNYKGTAKTSVKFTTDVTVLGVDGVSELTSPIIMEISFSIPVGTTSAQIVEMRQRAVAMLDLDTIMDPLNNQLMI